MGVAGHHMPIWYDEANPPADGQIVVWDAAAQRWKAAPIDISALDTGGLASDADLAAGLATKQDTIPPGTYVEPPAAAEKVVYLTANGSDANHGRSPDKGKLTFAAALTAIGAGNPGHIEMGVGTISLGAGVSLSGHCCTFTGQGDSTVLQVTGTQVGPALDFTGYLSPSSASYKREIGNFTLRGDGTAGSAKKGIRFDTGTPTVGVHLHDIAVENTGGECFDFGSAELCDFERLVANQPINCYENDIPYITGTEAMNGNRFDGIGLRSITPATEITASSNGASLPQATLNVLSTATMPSSGTTYVSSSAGLQTVTYTGKTSTTLTGCTGGTGTISTGDSVVVHPDCASGVVRFANGANYQWEYNAFSAWWFEYLHLPTGGSLFSMTGGYSNVVSDFQWFDSSKLTRATGTAYVRILPSTVPANGDFGGNWVRGHIPGKGTAASNIDVGVDVQQQNNRVTGIKGYNGTNVQIAAGVNRTFVELGGCESTATGTAVVDNSATTTNVKIDWVNGTIVIGDTTLSRGAVNALRVAGTANTTIGVLELGSAGTKIQTVAGGAAMYLDSDVHHIRSIGGVEVMTTAPGGFNPAVTFIGVAGASGRQILRCKKGDTTTAFDVDNAGNMVGSFGLAVGQSAAAATPADNATITTANIGVARVAPTAARTGIILQAGTIAGQTVTVLNEAAAANSITFAAASSNVADANASPIPGLTARRFVWDSGTSLWYRCG